MGNEIRIGLIGCGRVAENHAIAIQKCSGAVLTAAAGGRKAAVFGQRHHIEILDVNEICESDLVDVILILTPPSTHFAYAARALKANKHVLVEKPVSFDAGEIDEMARLAKENKVICMPGHSYLYIPELSRMAHQIPSGGIGTPTYLHLSETYYMPPSLISKYEGPEVDVLCHQLYLSLAFLGKPQRIYAVKASFSKDIVETGGPQTALLLSYRSGALAQISVSWACDDETSDPWTFKVKALGVAGGMSFSRRNYVQKTETGWEQALYQESFDEQMAYFIHQCIRGGKAPLSTIEDAAVVCRLHQLVLQSIQSAQALNVEL